MKTTMTIAVILLLVGALLSCNAFKPKYGCPSNGKNVGAEKLLGGDAAAEKSARKARKFRS